MKIPRDLAISLIKFEITTDNKPWRESFEELYELDLSDDELMNELERLRDRINAKLDELIDELG